MRLLVHFSLWLMPMASLFAQEVGYLRVQTQAPEAWVGIDGQVVGRVAQGPFPLRPGWHRVVLWPPWPEAWPFPRPDTTVRVVAGDTVEVALYLPYVYRLVSLPDGADVWAGTRRLPGRTPMFYRSRYPLRDTLVFVRAGYRPARASVAVGPIYQQVFVELMPEEDHRPVPLHVRLWRRKELDYLSLGIGLAGAILSIRHRFRADYWYDRYLRTGDPVYRPRVRKHDILAGWFLGVSEVSLGIFALRLILR